MFLKSKNSFNNNYTNGDNLYSEELQLKVSWMFIWNSYHSLRVIAVFRDWLVVSEYIVLVSFIDTVHMSTHAQYLWYHSFDLCKETTS